MKSYKQTAHELLQSVVHNSVATGTSRVAKMTLPYYELAKELGMGYEGDNLDVRIIIKVEFVTEEEGLVDESKSTTFKNPTSN